MKIKLVTDCSANICANITQDISYVPLKIVTQNKEYIDTEDLNVPEMLKELQEYKGKSGTACPGVTEWLDAFGDADIVLGVSLTSNLSGCYNAAIIAAEEYMQAKPGAKVFILDSLTTGPELQLILEKYQELIDRQMAFEDICREINEYLTHTHLIFSLASVDNFAKNGRVNPMIAKAVGLLGLRIVGRASAEGTLEPMHKCRGEKKALQTLMTTMNELGYRGGKVRLSHSYNPAAADAFADMIRASYPNSDITICCNRGLCCYYAEEGSLLIGFEDGDTCAI